MSGDSETEPFVSTLSPQRTLDKRADEIGFAPCLRQVRFSFRIRTAAPNCNAQPDRITTDTGRAQTGRTLTASGICHPGDVAVRRRPGRTIRLHQIVVPGDH